MGQASMKNFGIVSVSTGYDAAATSVVLSTGDGAKLPSPSATVPSYLVWWNSTDYTDPANDPNVEIVKCTARSTDTLTVVRGQEGSGASTKNTATKTYKMSLAFTAGLYDSIYADHRFPACGRFRYDDSQECLFVPHYGNKTLIEGKVETIPDAGVSFPNTSLAVSTLYYAYVYMSSGVMTKEWSTTAYATEAGTGNTIKSGDATRTLVGLAFTNASGEFDDSAQLRHVISWYNRRRITGEGAFTTDRTTASNTWTEINSEIRVSYLTWPDDAPVVFTAGACKSSADTGAVTTALSIDSTTVPTTAQAANASGANGRIPLAITYSALQIVGRHTATLLGATDTGTATWYAADDDTLNYSAKCHIFVNLMG